jgi:hypothetical protein
MPRTTTRTTPQSYAGARKSKLAVTPKQLAAKRKAGAKHLHPADTYEREQIAKATSSSPPLPRPRQVREGASQHA